MKIAIMQPTYFPWLGYFHLIHSVDQFVFLDDVPMAQQRRNWQKENRILCNGEVRWLRVNTDRVNGPDTLLTGVRVDHPTWRDQNLSLLKDAYGTASGYAIFSKQLEAVLEANHDSLADLNICSVTLIAEALGLKTPCLRSSEIDRPMASKADTIISLCQALGATRYLSPLGSQTYCDKGTFAKHGIKLIFDEHTPMPYQQNSDNFISHLSGLDLLMQAPEAVQDYFD